MRIKKVLHDNILVKIKKQAKELITKSGIIITGIEQDFFIAEVVMVGPGKWQKNKNTQKDEFIPTTIKVGDMVVLEKNFHHVFDIRERNRIDHTIEIEKSDLDYDYYLTKAEDCYLKFDNPEDAKNTEVYGELYSIMSVKEVVKRA